VKAAANRLTVKMSLPNFVLLGRIAKADCSRDDLVEERWPQYQ
jgi:hypothetical protein